MTILDSIIIAIVEGITEFLPVSSTGHLIVTAEILGIPQSDVLTSFQVIIQVAAILAVAIIYCELLRKHTHLLWKACLTFIPMGIVGFLFADQIRALFDIAIVAWAFIIVGVIFLIVESFIKHGVVVPKTFSSQTITQKQTIWIGLAQACALIPGVSRSGATIIGGLLGGLDRRSATEFSFLAAIPAMIAVTAYDVSQNYEIITASHLDVFIVGLVVTFIVAYLFVKLLIQFVQRYTFVIFGWYRIILGIILLFFFT